VPFTLRDFRPDDFDTLWRIDQSCFADGISYSRAELRLYIRRRGSFTLVAVKDIPEQANVGRSTEPGSAPPKREPDRYALNHESGGQECPPLHDAIAGFIVAEMDRGSGHIITIDVIAAARRSGLGSLLLRSAEIRLRAAGCRTVELEAAVDNASALAFYKRHGYSVIKVWPRYYSNGVDALVLQKSLA